MNPLIDFIDATFPYHLFVSSLKFSSKKYWRFFFDLNHHPDLENNVRATALRVMLLLAANVVKYPDDEHIASDLIKLTWKADGGISYWLEIQRDRVLLAKESFEYLQFNSIEI